MKNTVFYAGTLNVFDKAVWNY